MLASKLPVPKKLCSFELRVTDINVIITDYKLASGYTVVSV